MWISSAQVISYGSFEDSGVIEFAPGINLIIGENNSGKSALLKAIGDTLDTNSHRNENTYLPGQLSPPVVKLDIATTTGEIRQYLATTGDKFAIPSPGPSVADEQTITKYFQRERDVTISAIRHPGSELQFNPDRPPAWCPPNPPYGGTIQVKSNEWQISPNGSASPSLPAIFDSSRSTGIFCFRAQRTPPAQHGYIEASRLNSTATNLPVVLAYLESKRPDIFLSIIEKLRDIIGNIHSVTIAPNGSNCEIMIWPSGLRAHENLSFSLDQSGTGVAQVLAILTAVATTERSVIIVDEINSFLHPRAVKRLIQTIQTFYAGHQFIISTHSAEVVSYSRPSKAYIVQREGYKSAISEINSTSLEGARELSRTLGVSMMDVFGASKILWVEGQTEAYCFPILHALSTGCELPADVKTAAVFSTADFLGERRSSRSIHKLYDHIARTSAPLIEASAFSLDRERMSDDAVERAERDADGRLKILPRRTLENYAVEPTAIAKVINQHLGSDAVTTEQANDWLVAHGGDEAYGASKIWKGDLSDPLWLLKVDAPNLLSAAFAFLSDNKVEFRKTSHTSALLLAIREHDGQALAELELYLSDLYSILL